MFKDESEFKKIVDRLNIDTDPNPAHRQSLRQKMLCVFNESNNQSQKSATPFSAIRRIIMKSPVTKLAAAAIIIAVLIGLHYFGNSIDMTTSAYAEIVQRLQNARTLTFTLNAPSPAEGMPDMTMEMAFKESGYVRVEMPGGYVSVIDVAQGKGISIIPERKQFIDIQMSNMPNNPVRQHLDAIEKLRTLPERADEELGVHVIEGREVHGVRVTEDGMINTVWIDVKTRELVLVERESVNAPGMSGTLSNFKFDVELDDSLFSLTPPKDYTRLELQVDVSERTEQDLIELLRAWTTWNKSGVFPPTLDPTKLAKYSMEMQKQGEFDDSQTTERQRIRHEMQMMRGMMFLMKLPADSNWRYAGENVKFGDSGTAIFWYRPEGSDTCRVIYGDLTVKDVTQENLPK
ncbi:MAG: DUF2092 domain-containing protein [Sedimentisphaerales bacterium]|nr:DUF2092 domain-containing protein [Sedimentisphaerales bacterium]